MDNQTTICVDATYQMRDDPMQQVIMAKPFMSSILRKMRLVALATAASILLILSRGENRCDGFALPPMTPAIHPQCRRQSPCCQNLFPVNLEDWESCDVEEWLCDIGFGRYTRGFAADYSGIGVDGDRLIYLGTEDQLDHIEYQLSLIGVDDESDQRVLGSAIIELVAATKVTPKLLESLAGMVPAENRDKNNKGNDKAYDSLDSECDGELDFEI